MFENLKFFQSLFLLQVFFCVFRYYLIDGKGTKYFCTFIFFIISCSIIGAIIYDIFYLGTQFDNMRKTLNIVSGVEILFLANAARGRRTFKAIDRFYEKCGTDDDFTSKMKRKIRTTAVINIISSTVNFSLAFTRNVELCTTLLLGVSSSAFDSEIDCLRLLIEGFNLRLSKLKESNPSAGSRIYRHALLASSHLGEECNSRILFIFFMIQIKTVIYTGEIFLFKDNSMIMTLLIWRQVWQYFCLWRFCLTAGNTKNICNSLSLQLSKRLVLDDSLNKERFRRNYDITRRWQRSVFREQPKYLCGPILVIDLNIPLDIVDASINYWLIFVQVYAAFS